jgi:hypothetical protein
VVGPLFGDGFGQAPAWTTTEGRWILQILPGAAVFLGGLMLMAATSRIMGIVGGLLASAGGAWFVLGPILSMLWDPTGLRNEPLGTGALVVAEQIGLFAGLGVVVLFLGAGSAGRFTMRGHRDAEFVQAARQRQVRRERARTVTAGVPAPVRRSQTRRVRERSTKPTPTQPLNPTGRTPNAERRIGTTPDRGTRFLNRPDLTSC